MTVLLILALPLIYPAILGCFLAQPALREWRARTRYSVGAPIVYCREEVSTHPGADAQNVRPAVHGDFYYYNIISYLRVADVLSDGRIVAVTRDNQRHYLQPNDSNLRKARLRDRLLHPRIFPVLSP